MEMLSKLVVLFLFLLSPIMAVEPPPALEPQIFPGLNFNPFQPKPEEILKHVRLVNPGAEISIYVIDDAPMFTWYCELPPETTGYIIGLFKTDRAGAKAPRIYILGQWSEEAMVAIHEYQHYIEYMVPDRRRELREAFLKLEAPGFGIGAGDLQDHIPQNGKANPIGLGFPADE